MKYIFSLLTIFLIVLVSVSLGIIIYVYIAKPVLYKLCIIGTETCIRVAYWSYKNSVLAHLEPEGYWVWFNGDRAYVYDVSLGGNMCPLDPSGKKYSPAYVVPITGRLPKPTSFECIDTLDQLITMYEGKGVKKQFLYKRVKDRIPAYGQQQAVPDFGYMDMLNLLANKNIINLKNIR